jgi:hypothetical protein
LRLFPTRLKYSRISLLFSGSRIFFPERGMTPVKQRSAR